MNEKFFVVGVAAVTLGLIISLGLGVSAFLGLLFMLVWNEVLAPAAELPELSFLAAWAIWFLISVGTRSVFVVIRGRE